MSFVQVTEAEARVFVAVAEASGIWRQAPLKGEWEAFRLAKLKPTFTGEPYHSDLDKIIVVKNKKGVHSFDSRHLPIYDHCKSLQDQALAGGTTGGI